MKTLSILTTLLVFVCINTMNANTYVNDSTENVRNHEHSNIFIKNSYVTKNNASSSTLNKSFNSLKMETSSDDEGHIRVGYALINWEDDVIDRMTLVYNQNYNEGLSLCWSGHFSYGEISEIDYYDLTASFKGGLYSSFGETVKMYAFATGGVYTYSSNLSNDSGYSWDYEIASGLEFIMGGFGVFAQYSYSRIPLLTIGVVF